jgi:NTP pyrophosphatase (non-canonical NTP hydrolase)
MITKDKIKEHYKITVNRGLIHPGTSFKEFTNKIQEELNEVINEGETGKGLNKEIADVILTCYNMAYHYSIDIEKELLEKIEINKNRVSKNKIK